MEKEKLIFLNHLYDDFLEDKKNIENKLNDNISTISQIDAYLKSIDESEGEDVKVFSPRDAKSVHKEEIQNKLIEKEKRKNENDSYYLELKQYEEKADTLRSMISELEDDNRESSLNYQMQEKDRQRIAGELHDFSLQTLTHLIHKIELSSMFIEQDPIRAKLELATVSKHLRNVIEDIRETIFDLRPMAFDDLGLKEALENLFVHLKEKSEIEIEYELDDIQQGSKENLMNIFRIVQECCLNVIKHAEADKMNVVLKSEDNKVDIQVIDNGIGFEVQDKKENHFGLSMMKERVSLLNGNIDIQSIPNEGTTIHILLQLR